MGRKIFTLGILVSLAVACLFAATIAPTTSAAAEKSKVLIGFKEMPGPAEQALVHGFGGEIKYTYHLIPAIAATVPDGVIAALRANPNVRYVEKDGVVKAIGQTLPWGVDRIDADLAWAKSTGQDADVAVLDTGIDYDHEDLANNVKGGICFVFPKSGSTKPRDWDDKNGHGTHCAGTIAAEHNTLGVVGVAYQASLYAVKVLGNDGTGYYSDLIEGIQWCVDTGKDVASMSLGGTSESTSLQAACDSAYAAGLLLVAAAGNEGDGDTTNEDAISYPAYYESVIAVGATNQGDNVCDFSTSGSWLELSAPGKDILSTLNGDLYGYGSGTSMSCPHVSGVGALVIASGTLTDENEDGVINNVDLRLRLQNTAEDLGPVGKDNGYGYGLVDAAAAVGIVEDTTPPAKVTGLTVTTVSCAQLDLAWNANTEEDLHHYNVYRRASSGGPHDLIASPTINSYSDVGLTASTTYYYVVTAVDNSGNEGEASDEVSGTTSADDLGPVTLDVAADPNPTNGATSVTLTADVSDATTGNSTIAGAEYFVDTVSADGSGTPMSASDGAFDSATEGVTATIGVSGWTVGQYTLYVHGKDAAGNWGATESVVLDVTEAPSNIMYVESIVFSSKVAGPNKFLYTTVKVVDGDGSPLGGVGVEMTLDWDKEGNGTIDDSWNFAGDTGTDGTAKFTLLKAPSGYYTATVTSLTLTDYTWDMNKGVTSASCELQDDGTVIQGAAKVVASTSPGNSLGQNYPNPANPSTEISYSLGQSGPVTLKIYNPKGQLVRTLVDDIKASGTYTVRWDGRDKSGALVASGIYFYRMVTGNYSQTKRMILLR